MQIHELNNYSGSLGAGVYLAVDNGNDTGKVSASQLLADTNAEIEQVETDLNARIDNIIAGGTAPSEAEIVDARLGATKLGGVSYASLGAAIRGQATILSDENSGLYRMIESGIYSDKKYDATFVGGSIPGSIPSGQYIQTIIPYTDVAAYDYLFIQVHLDTDSYTGGIVARYYDSQGQASNTTKAFNMGGGDYLIVFNNYIKTIQIQIYIGFASMSAYIDAAIIGLGGLYSIDHTVTYYDELMSENYITKKHAELGLMVNDHHLTGQNFFQCEIRNTKVGDRLCILAKTNNLTAETGRFMCRNFSAGSGASNVVRSIYIGDGNYFIDYTVVNPSDLQILIWPYTATELYGVDVGLNGIYVGDTVYVDCDDGDDDSDGLNFLFPKKTITSALNAGNDIIAKAGVYEESVSIKKRQNVRISKKFTNTANQNYKNISRVIIRNPQVKLTFALGSSGVYECTYNDFDSSSNMYKVFISRTLAPITNAGGVTGNAFNATIFKYNGTYESIALKPVLTLAECQNEAETFFYDGTKIYLNTATFNGFEYMTAVKNNRAFTIEDCNGVELNQLKFEMGYGEGTSLVGVYNSRNCRFVDCVGLLCATSTNFYTSASDVDFIKCQSYRSAADGFAPVVSGTNNYIDCIGAYNKDDGVSHHDGCDGVVQGGEYHHNGKGGVATPTHGSHVDLYNIFSHDNDYGFYAVANADVPLMPVKMFGCVSKGNRVGIAILNYEIYGYNNKFTDNQQAGDVNQIIEL